MPTWATPRWQGDWDGDPDSVLRPLEAAYSLLRDAGHTFRVHIQIFWEHGQAHEDSIEGARKAVRFAQPPERILGILSMRQDDAHFVADAQAQSIEGARLILEAKSLDYDLADRLVAAGSQSVQQLGSTRPSPDQLAPSKRDDSKSTEPAPPEPARSGPERSEQEAPGSSAVLTWIEGHVGLITLIGVLLTGAGVIVAVVAL